MKVVSAQQMSQLERRAYQQGCSEKDFMENAGFGVAKAAEHYIEKHQKVPIVWLLCGKGNNGGDAFVAGRYLLERGFQVTAIQFEPLEQCSPLCKTNGKLFLDKKGKLVRNIESFSSSGIILDGLFGTGFKGSIKEPYASLIEKANQSSLPILAIDIPSGLDGTTGRVEGKAIQAVETIYLGLPKTGFFLENGWNLVGKLTGVDFGLPSSIIEEAKEDFHLITEQKASSLIPPIQRNRHKYQAGFVVGLAGSLTMPGSGLLASLAAFRTGSGMVRLLYPDGMENLLASSPYELIKIPYSHDRLDEIIPVMQKAAATFIGPGLGKSEATRKLLQKIVPSLEKPCVLDADALTLFAEEPFSLPSKTLFTPHTGEMQKLLKSQDKLHLKEHLLHQCQEYTEKHKITLILKGAPTFIFHPDSPIFVNPTGDPGMATAGSGDVLTGILASLLSQGLDCQQTAILGVYLHGLAGELASQERGTSFGVMANDIIEHIGESFQQTLHNFVN